MWALLLVLALVGVACASEGAHQDPEGAPTTSTDPVPSSTGHDGTTDSSVPVATPEFVRPTLPIGGTDDSVIQLVEEIFEWAQGPSEQLITAVSLDRCEVIAPGYWRFTGSIESDVAQPTEAPVAFSFSIGDLGTGVAWRAEIRGSGAFDVVIEDTGSWDRVGRCAIAVDTDSFDAWADATASGEPLTWDAPEGTIQALGIGAVMSDRTDLRRAWAGPIWLGTPLPFERILAPEADSGIPMGSVHVSIDEDSPCRTISQDLADTGWIDQWRGCDVPTRTPGRLVPPPPDGWPFDGTVVELERTVRFTTSIDGFDLSVGARDVDELVRTLEGLTWYTNLQPAPEVDSPYVGDDLDAVVASTLEIDGYLEMARFSTDDGVTVVTRGPIVGDDTVDPFAQARTYEFELRNSAWVGSYAGGGGWDSCIFQGRALRDGTASVFLVGYESDWTFEALADDEWFAVPMDGGAAFLTEDVFARADAEPGGSIEYRAVTSNGTVIDCATFIPEYALSRTDTTHVVGEEPTTDISAP